MIVFDDVQRLFRDQEMAHLQSIIINTILFPIRDENHACIMFVTSDFWIEEDMKKLSGMDTRLKSYKFPRISKKDHENYLLKNFYKLKNLNNLLTFDLLEKFHEDFNSDLRALNAFIFAFDGDYESINSI